MKPRVSVIMPVLNGQRYIAEAIRSIEDQAYRHHELIVIDDGSSDNTPTIVNEFATRMDLKYVRHTERQGIAPSMNDGIRHSTGDFISFLDHDDAWFPDFLSTQVRFLQEHTDYGMVHSDFQTTDVDGNVLESSVAVCRQRKRPSGHVFRELFLDSFIVGNSVLIRRECFDRLGTFDERLRWGDYHMWMRIARHYKIGYVPKVLTTYRQHPTQSTRTVHNGRPDEDPVALQAIRNILELYPEVSKELGEDTIRRRISTFYFDLAYSWYVRGMRREARVCLRRALGLWPTNPRYVALYAGCLLPPSGTAAASALWRRVRATRTPAIQSSGTARL